MKKPIDFVLRHLVGIVALLFISLFAYAASFTPPSVGAYIFSGGVWTPAPTTTNTGGISFTPPAVSLYCFNSTTNQWVPADSNCFGSGGGGAVLSVSNSDGSLTVTPTTGAVVASLNLGHTNTFTVGQGITTSGASGSNLTLINTNGSNQANIDFQSSGGDEVQLANGSSGFGLGYFYVYDKSTNFVSLAVGTNQVNTGISGVIGWTANNNATFNPDTGFSRDAAGTIDAGNGTLGNKSATIKAAHLFAGVNEVTVTAASTTTQAMCLKSAGPPVVLGICASVVSAGGSCTCN